MTRNTGRRSGPDFRDRRVALVAVGILAGVALLAVRAPADAAQSDSSAVAASEQALGAAAASDEGSSSRKSKKHKSSSSSQTSATQTPEASQSSDPAPTSDPAQASGGANSEPIPAGGTDPTATTASASNPTNRVPPTGQVPSDGTATATASQDILGNTCPDPAQPGNVPLHTGFQDGNRCVTTQFGEVADADHNPSLVIASAPLAVHANKPFDLRVSTRNLVRDRFLAAAKGGYYKESSFLNDQGLVRGHFHTACRMLTSRRDAPDPAPVPAFFVATEDGGGGSAPDTVTVRVAGLPQGIAQCAVWAGDGSHRIPMMQRANQIPAFDVVRIFVTR
jgi:hypothetical protein